MNLDIFNSIEVVLASFTYRELKTALKYLKHLPANMEA